MELGDVARPTKRSGTLVLQLAFHPGREHSNRATTVSLLDRLSFVLPHQPSDSAPSVHGFLSSVIR